MNKFMKKMCKNAEHERNEWYAWGEPADTCHMEIEKCEFCKVRDVCAGIKKMEGMDHTMRGFNTFDNIIKEIAVTAEHYASIRMSQRDIFNEEYEIACLVSLLHTAKAWMIWDRWEYDISEVLVI